MCGRFAATATPDTLVEEYDIEFVDSLEPVVGPRWNVAPTSPVFTVQVDGEGATQRTLGVSRWGLTPSWAKQPMTLINARVETVTEKPSFRSAIRKRRCVVPADGYYEWREERDGGKTVKQPYFLRPEQGTLAMPYAVSRAVNKVGVEGEQLIAGLGE